MSDEKSKLPMLVVSDLYWSIAKSQTDPEIFEINESFNKRMTLAMASEFYGFPYEEIEANKEKYIQKMAFKAPEQIRVFGYRSSIVLADWQAWSNSLPKPETKKKFFSQITSYLGFSKA